MKNSRFVVEPEDRFVQEALQDIEEGGVQRASLHHGAKPGHQLHGRERDSLDFEHREHR